MCNSTTIRLKHTNESHMTWHIASRVKGHTTSVSWSFVFIKWSWWNKLWEMIDVQCCTVLRYEEIWGRTFMNFLNVCSLLILHSHVCEIILSLWTFEHLICTIQLSCNHIFLFHTLNKIIKWLHTAYRLQCRVKNIIYTLLHRYSFVSHSWCVILN